jgi:hypothetical protein
VVNITVGFCKVIIGHSYQLIKDNLDKQIFCITFNNHTHNKEQTFISGNVSATTGTKPI